MSGFLRGWLREKSLETCALYGNASGALVVTRHGCSPAAPSFAEIDHFIRNFDRIPALAHHPKMQQLHLRTELGQPQKEELLILAYDHRTQFEESCRENNLSFDYISRFKEQVYEGFQKVRKSNKKTGAPAAERLAILIDPDYGQMILNNFADAAYTIGVPIEKAGSFPVSWLMDDSLYQHLLERPATWFVKVLWRFHLQMNQENKDIQLRQLHKLNSVCVALKRKLMVELIIPEGYLETGTTLGEAMAEVYEAGIYPFWWKITALDSKEEWQTMTKTLDQYDPEVGVIILGKNAPIEQFQTWFRVARSTPHTCGFAVGRSIFWEPWEQYVGGKLTIKGIADAVAERYNSVLEIWSKTQD